MNGLIKNIDGIPTLSVQSADQVTGFTLIDVRRPEEFNDELGHIQGATQHTLGPALADYLASTPKDEKILFICRGGMRSANATAQALQAGFTQVLNLEGGMMLWNQKGLPISRE